MWKLVWKTAHGLCGVGKVFAWPGSGKFGRTGRSSGTEKALKTTPVGVVRKKGGQRPHNFGEEWGCTAEIALPR